ncbi:MAG: tyrosine-type recombinase/integrase [Acidimicrobiia bacterium]
MSYRRNNPSGHIEKRGDAWRVVIEAGRDPASGKRRRIVRSGLNYQLARRELRRLLTDLEEQTYVEPSQTTVTSYLWAWFQGHAMVAAENTLEVYGHQIRAYVVPYIGGIPLQDLAPTDLDQLYATLLRSGRRNGTGLALKTVRNVHVMLHRALEDAMEHDLIRRNPAGRAKPPSTRRARKPAAERPTWSSEEAKAFLSYVVENRLRALYALVLTTGLRRSEVLGVSWNRLDLEDGHLTVVQALVEVGNRPKLKPLPKTDHSRRRIALDTETVGELRNHRKRQLEERLAEGDRYDDQGLVFARQDGSPIRPSWLSRTFSGLAAGAGLPDLSPRSFHGLRHTYATLALEAGVPIEVVSKRLGHASIATTADLYQHVTRHVDKDAAEAVAGLIFAGS